MIKRLFTLALLAGSMAMAQAQVLASLGFEDGDNTYPYLGTTGTYGDWVNRQEIDDWTEKYTADKHSGEYCFSADNGSSYNGQTWDRGFKVGNLQLKDNTSYRVSFWIKADGECIYDGNTVNTGFKSHLSTGVENYDNAIVSPSLAEYVYNYQNMTGEWQHVSFVTYFKDKATQDAVIPSKSWVGTSVCPEAEDGTTSYRDYYQQKFPETYFLIINMFNPAHYLLDDILIEENVVFNEVSYNMDMIRIDFGYPTNIKVLANATDGTFSLDPSCVTLTVNGEIWNVEFVEGKSDGYLYAFVQDSEEIPEDAEVKVSFTPADDCPIVYDTDRRPSDNVEGTMPVVAFESETGYYDPRIDVMPSIWSPAEFVSSVPENESFELVAEEFKQIVLTYNKPLSLDYASATLKSNGMEVADLTDGCSLSEDLCSIIVDLTEVAPLADGEYTLEMAGVANAMGVECESDLVLTFAVGPDNDITVSKTVYSTKPTFEVTANGTFPKGWVSNDNGTIHEYVVMEDGSIGNYNWGGNLGGGGCRAMTGYSGDFNGAAIYWRTMNGANQLGTLTFGEQVSDFILSDGTIDLEMDPEIALQLEPSKYQIAIKMAAWKNFNGDTEWNSTNPDNIPQYSFTLEDLEGNVYAEFNNIPAKPNLNGAQDKAVTGATVSEADFTVQNAGYYVLKFSTTQPNAELLLGGVDIITMPSKAAYWKQQLAAAVEAAKAVLESAADPIYDGDTKSNLANEITAAETGHFTCPSDVKAEIALLQQIAAALQARMTNIDNYDAAILEVLTALEDLSGTKYENTPEYQQGQELAANYGNVDPSTLSDEELASVAPTLTSLAASIKNAKSVADILSYRASLAAATAAQLNINDPAIAELDNVVDEGTAQVDAANKLIKSKLYELIAANNNQLPEELCKSMQYLGVKGEPEDAVYDEATDSYPVAVKGIDLTSFVFNPRLYRVNGDNGVPGWAITSGDPSHGLNIAYNTSASAENRAVDAQINIYGEADYDFSQVISNLPAGVYSMVIKTRTPLVDKTEAFGKIFYYNAQNDSTGVWDKYVFVNNGTDQAVSPYVGAGGLTDTFVKDILAADGKITIGAHEHYVSGKAEKHEDNTPQSFWTGTTYVDDVRIFLVDTDPNFNYAEGDALAGDADANGEVNGADISVIASYILGDEPDPFDAAAADFDGNEEINVN
ncbi:MAG: hypothetical protein KBS99_06765, partial [Prevotellaceae bacterium]|nr:hypothetical protein [Candidatus Colivivens caballi]